MRNGSDEKPRKPKYRWEIIGGLLAMLAICFVSRIAAYAGDELNSGNAAEFGDFIGGFVGTLLVVVTIALVSAGYRRQKYIEDLRSFEARFFEMLKYHRENMTEIDVDGIKGRRAFVSFIREWRLALTVVDKACEKREQQLEVKERAQLAYLAFFHGSGKNARVDLADAANKLSFDPILVEDLVEQMSKVWTEHPASNSANLCSPSSKDIARTSEEAGKGLSYAPFGGHHSRLAHYYRHLYQLVDYAHTVAPELSEEHHIALVTAQLSTHEQALLALHAFSLESRWSASPYIDKYQLIGDVPEKFIQPEEFPIWKIYNRQRHADKSKP